MKRRGSRAHSFNVLPNSYYAAEPIERIDGSTFDWSWIFNSGPRSLDKGSFRKGMRRFVAVS
jgi:hypothetical protein